MAGLLDDIGDALDRPWAAVGADPATISASPWARRGMVLQAFGNQLRNDAGHVPFVKGLGGFADMAAERQVADLKRQQQLQALQLQKQLGQVFSEDPMPAAQQQATQGALAAPGMPAGPTVQRGAIQQQALAQASPQKLKAEQYRRAARMVAAINPDTAEKYMKLADSLDPREEFYAPTEANGTFFQASKSGAVQPVQGFQPKGPELPPDVRAVEYVTGQPLAGTGDAGFGALKDYRKAGAANVSATVTGAADKKFAETLAGDRATLLATEYPKAQAAASIIGSLNEVINRSQAGTFSGPLAPGAIGAAQFLQSMGVNVTPETLTNSRVLQASLNNLVLETMAANGGARGFTEKETAILMDAFPKLADDPNSRIAIARMMVAKNKSSIQRYNSLRAQSQKLPGFEFYGTPEVALPELTGQGQRPSLDEIFKGTKK